jgi:hypothetical protein
MTFVNDKPIKRLSVESPDPRLWYASTVDRVAFASVDELVVACRERGVRAVAMRVIDEIRPRRRDDGSVEVGPQKFVELFAYRDGTVLTVLVRDQAPATIEVALRSAGLEVRRRSGNLG